MDCGACCFSESERHARVTGDDYARLGDDAERLVLWIENLAFMRLTDITAGPERQSPRHCAALVIDSKGGIFACSIYNQRPQVCRDLARGSNECRGELGSKGERPRRALAILRTTKPA